MNTIKSNQNDSTITADYDDFTNSVEISISGQDGGKIVNLDADKVDHLIEILCEFKNSIV